MKDFLLHVGYGKTGTSAIQHMLATNRGWLAERGVLYPDVKRYGTWAGMQNHNFLGFALSGHTGWMGLSPSNYFSQFHDQYKRNGNYNRILLSSESFAGGMVQPWDFAAPEAYQQAITEKIQTFRHLIGDDSAKILIYLRRQDDYLESAIDQAIKNEVLAGKKLFVSVEQFTQVMYPRLDYGKVIDTWAEIFGKENIEVAVYEKDQFKNDSLFDDFLSRCGLDDLNGLQLANTTAASDNLRFNRDVAEFKRIFNRTPKPKYEESLILKILQEISTELQEDKAVDSGYLSFGDKQALMEKFTASNRHVAVNYLQHRDGILFHHAPKEDTQAKPYPGLSAERALEIFFRYSEKRKLLSNQVWMAKAWLGRYLRVRAPFVHAMLYALKNRGRPC